MASRFLVLLVAFAVAPAVLGATVLYDDAAGDVPDDQPWLFYAGLGGTAAQLAVAAGVRAVSDGPAASGYSNYAPRLVGMPPALVWDFKNPAFPALDRGVGFALSFELRINSESHSRNDRAGFSVILLADDKQGIELGFWGDQIWAQSGAPAFFTHAEGTAFDTLTAEVRYRLVIHDDMYRLSAGGAEILSGTLRDYSGAGVSLLGVNPYDLPGYLFLGDDTSSAAVDYMLGQVVIGAVPLPAALALLPFALLSLPVLRRRRGAA